MAHKMGDCSEFSKGLALEYTSNSEAPRPPTPWLEGAKEGIGYRHLSRAVVLWGEMKLWLTHGLAQRKMGEQTPLLSFSLTFIVLVVLSINHTTWKPEEKNG